MAIINMVFLITVISYRVLPKPLLSQTVFAAMVDYNRSAGF